MRILSTLLLGLMFTGTVWSQDLQMLPPPEVVTTCLPEAYFSLDFALVQPRIKDAAFVGGPSFSTNLDWTVSPRFELGFLNRGAWNPYIGYKGIYSDANESVQQQALDSFYDYYHSTELHAIDFGVLSEPFALLSVIRAQWDFSVRLTVV